MSLDRYIDFEWDEGKAEDNLRKHGVSFESAADAFSDPCARVVSDPSGLSRPESPRRSRNGSAHRGDHRPLPFWLLACHRPEGPYRGPTSSPHPHAGRRLLRPPRRRLSMLPKSANDTRCHGAWGLLRCGGKGPPRNSGTGCARCAAPLLWEQRSQAPRGCRVVSR